jgi:flagellar hook-length control protein FliK
VLAPAQAAAPVSTSDAVAAWRSAVSGQDKSTAAAPASTTAPANPASGLGAAAPASAPVANNIPSVSAPTATVALAPPTAATPAALAATITAMHQSGAHTTTLRLDPPGLGDLSVHVALGQNGQVNVLFVPSVAQTGQLLNSGMDGLRQAMAASGLSLGHASVGGQGGGNQSANQNANQGGTSSSGLIRETSATPAAARTLDGLSAYA